MSPNRGGSHELLESVWTYPLALLSVVAICWYIIYWGLAIVGWWTARQRYSRRPRSPLASLPASAVPGVSIIRPLKGLDPNLYENLESSFLQEYSNFEIIFSVHAPSDPAVRVVEQLQKKYPTIPVLLITNEEVIGVNPKVNNLIQPFRQAKHDIVWVLDSNVKTQPGTLARSVEALTREFPAPSTSGNGPHFRKRVGVVHHVPQAVLYGARDTLGSRVEAAFLNTTHAKMYIAINKLALDSCVMGKSNLYRRSDVDCVTSMPEHRGQWKKQPMAPNGEPELPTYGPEVVTGLRAMSAYLAEDNILAACFMHELGLLHDMSPDVAVNAISTNMKFSDYVERRVRWIRVRKHIVISATLLEPFTECIMLGLVGFATIAAPWGIPWAIFAVLHVAGWLALDLGVYAAIAGHPLPRAEWANFLVAWAIRELSAFPIWLVGVLGTDVTWRGVKYTVKGHGKVAKVEPTAAKRLGSGQPYSLLPTTGDS
ncbi:glycosyltransferase family 21 protein [Clavulina sp. PMI_390]|nr:glycosyltransferase family 21 protein [Clavulina sp. PMI_390]